MTHTEFRDKKNKNNIDMVTQIETLFIFMFDGGCNLNCVKACS